MVCKFCGNVIEDNSEFCFICGQKVVNAAPAAPVTAPVEPQAPVYAAPAQAPVYAAPAPQAPVAPQAPATKKSAKKEAKAAKKAAKRAAKAEKEAAVTELSKKKKFFTGLLPALFIAILVAAFSKTAINIYVIIASLVLIGLFAKSIYTKYQINIQAGNEQKAYDLANTAMIGSCVGMAIVVLYLVVTYIF